VQLMLVPWSPWLQLYTTLLTELTRKIIFHVTLSGNG